MGEREAPQELKFLQPPEIRGVSKQLILDLMDIAKKFGRVTPEDLIISFSSGDLGNELRLNLTTHVNSNNLWVFKSNVPQSGITILETNQGQIWWDNNLTAQEAKIAVAKIDAVAFEAGLMNRSSGERLPLPPEASFARQGEYVYRVEEVFDNPGAAMPTFGEDPERLLGKFDKPEELTVTTRWMQGRKIQTIIRKKDIEYHEKRERIAREILEEQGIDFDDPQVIDNMSFEKIMEIRQETERRMRTDQS